MSGEVDCGWSRTSFRSGVTGQWYRKENARQQEEMPMRLKKQAVKEFLNTITGDELRSHSQFGETVENVGAEVMKTLMNSVNTMVEEAVEKFQHDVEREVAHGKNDIKQAKQNL